MASDDNLLNDDEIRQLLESAEGAGPPAETPESGQAAGASADAPAAAEAVEVASADAAEDAVGAGGTSPDDPGGGAAVTPGDEAAVTRARAAAGTEELLNQVEAGLNAALSGDGSSGNVVGGLDGAVPFELSSFDEVASGKSAERYSLGTLDDIELELQIELGRAELLIEEVLSLREGAVVPLDKLAGDPVDILVNGRLLARGEVLVLNDNFCVRVAEIVSPDF